jgi:hypothetical protein
MLQVRERAPIPSLIVFILGFAFESFQEFGGASSCHKEIGDVNM